MVVLMMNNQYIVGNVLSIDGTKITIIMRQNTNAFSYFYNGETYRGITIGEYVGIIRGPYKIIARVEKEYLSDKLKNEQDQTYSINRFERHIEVVVMGSFSGEKFDMGIRYLPMVYNEVVLLNEDEISLIVGNGLNKNNDKIFVQIGNTVQQNLKTDIPINGLYNSHIGIFGNTGSGKSNTLTKLYTELFNHKKLDVTAKSKFVVLDFNGEYTGTKVFIDNVNKKKEVLELSTDGSTTDKFKLDPADFWNKETLSILFSATEKTQQPFIQNMLNFYAKDRELIDEKIGSGIVQGYRFVFAPVGNKDSLRIFKKVIALAFFNGIEGENVKNQHIPHYNSRWHSKSETYYHGGTYINKHDISDDIETFQAYVDGKIYLVEQLSIIDKLLILVNLQLIYGLAYNHIQYDHISPLLSRIESTKSFFEQTIKVVPRRKEKPLTIISLKNCNLDAKKILPLLIAKQLYRHHIKDSNTNGTITKTCHLIVDEAHNILSEQSKKESDSFKDYRLDSFEQMIKEGRKFGFYLTISSQRPYDISPTIISQLHNYFIHRLVNDLDLKMIANSISTLDNLSKSRISNLAPGQCIITGTLFELPLLIQVQKLHNDNSPNSSNADILKLWEKIEEEQS